MLNMTKKNGVSPPREGTESAVRAAALSGAVESPSTPARPKRRAFTAEYKQRILREADAAVASDQDGAIGELLRREGLYSSHLTEWRRARDAGELAGLTRQKRGRKASRPALADEVARLQRRVRRPRTRAAAPSRVDQAGATRFMYATGVIPTSRWNSPIKCAWS
jgi:hypothetical protein